MDTLLEYLIADFHERPLPELTQREVALPCLDGKIDTVIGMRRTGKTWLLYQQMQDYLDQGVEKDRLLYINFDDERLQPIGREDLQGIPEAFYRLYPDNKRRRCYFFFDEIQNVDGWEPFVRRLLDTEDVQLALTGSSARLLSREIASTLRGRSLTTEVFPFSFSEALRHEGIDPHSGKSRPPGSGQRARYANRLEQYMVRGGFPEVQNIEARYRHQVLQEYVDVVILRDIVERHSVSNIVPLRYMIRSLLGAPATLFSINRFHNDLKSQGIAVGKNTLHEYLEYLVDACLVETVPIYSRSVRRQQSNPRKVYAIDTGLAQAFRHDAHIDKGRLLENMVFLWLRRQGLTITYLRTNAGYEVDFHAVAGDGHRQLIQVSATMHEDSTRKREFRALEAGMEECGLDRGTIVTLNERNRVESSSGVIDVVPAWELLRRGGEQEK